MSRCVVSDGEIAERLRAARKAGDSELVVMLRNWQGARVLLLGTKRRPRRRAARAEPKEADITRAASLLLDALNDGARGRMPRREAYLLLMREMPGHTHDEVARMARILYERGVVKRQDKELLLP